MNNLSFCLGTLCSILSLSNIVAQTTTHQCTGFTHDEELQLSMDDDLPSEPLEDMTLFESRPGAPHVIYLDFDGEYLATSIWSPDPIDAQPASYFTDEDITYICKVVAADYEPFDVNVTNNRAVYDESTSKVHCIFTTTNTWTTASGIAERNTFNFNFKAWSFKTDARYAGGTASHEIGHVLGLYHDGVNSDEYYYGHGSWAPIMGASGKLKSQWSNGDYPGGNNLGDDIAYIGSKLGFIPDDFGSELDPSRLNDIFIDPSGTFASEGLISDRHDKDILLFSTTGGNLHLDFGCNEVDRHSNLRLGAFVYDENWNMIWGDTTQVLSSISDIPLASGVYYLVFDGVGYKTPSTGGYSDYGSVGRYNFSGSIENSDDNFSDMSVVEVTPIEGLTCLEEITTEFTVKNTGLKAITSGYEIIISDKNGVLLNTYVSDVLQPGETRQYQYNVTPSYATNWNYLAEVSLSSDAIAVNDTLRSGSINYYFGKTVELTSMTEYRGSGFDWNISFDGGDVIYENSDYSFSESYSFCLPVDSCYNLDVVNSFQTYWCDDLHDFKFTTFGKPFGYAWQVGDTVQMLSGEAGTDRLYLLQYPGILGWDMLNYIPESHPDKFIPIVCDPPVGLDPYVRLINTTDNEVVFEGLFSSGEFTFNEDFCTNDLGVYTENLNYETITIHPNPTYGVINISGEYDELEVINILGNIVFSQKQYSKRIDIQDLAPGTYLVRFRLTNQVVISKLIVK